ncbi:MAG: type I polyketide synthase [Candidatus Methylopumilus sp.]|nr:type I polyketide synthase [Candidatus Methylopumilus sp.]
MSKEQSAGQDPLSAREESYRQALQKATQTIRQLLAENAALQKKEPIAIIGMACRFPAGANSPEQYWNLLDQGVDGVTEAPETRWKISDYLSSDKLAPGKMYTARGGFIDQPVDEFDARFFGISPREANGLDPQQRLLLEVSWEALEDAGILPATLKHSRTGVYVGLSGDDYARCHRHSGAPHTIDAYSLTGTTPSTAAGRISYTLGLQGPSMALDTACSSSLVALHLATRSLRSGETDMALVGGVNLILSPENHIAFSKLQAISPDGQCRSFDAKANGYVRSEGCAMVLLKRESDALRDGDKVLAVIRGTAINQDGKTNGLAAPNGQAQQAVIQEAFKDAGVTPAQIEYLEAHGTGTLLGDPIELEAIGQVMSGHRDSRLPVGSSKSNIGHMEPVAGLGGLIKIVLSLQHDSIPANLHFNQANPHVDWTELPLDIVDQPRDWPKHSSARIASLSSFGFSGTNAHVVISDSTETRALSPDAQTPSVPTAERPLHVLSLSALNEKSLETLARAYLQKLEHLATHLLADLCFSANTTRTAFGQRMALVASDRDSLMQGLQRFLAKATTPNLHCGQLDLKTASHRMAWLMTGQGSQYAGMGAELYGREPAFTKAIDRCAVQLDSYLDAPLTTVLFDTNYAKLNQTGYTQPALFALEYALAQTWLSWGIQPDLLAGHSVGEYVAACLAGVFSLEDGLKLIVARASLMQALPAGGTMAAIFADESTVLSALTLLDLHQDCDIAAINSSSETVIAGRQAAVTKLISHFQAGKIQTRELKVSHAFHSTLMEPILKEFEAVAQDVAFKPATIPLISNVTGKLAGTEILTPAYWASHIRLPVRFAETLKALREQGARNFLEIGPHPVLTSMAKGQLQADEDAYFASSLQKGRSAWETMTNSLAGLSVQGVSVDWDGFDRPFNRSRQSVPTYPFDRQRYWSDDGEAFAKQQSMADVRPTSDTVAPLFYQTVWKSLPRTQPQTSSAQSKVEAGTWLVLSEQSQQITDVELATALTQAGQTVVSAVLSDERVERDIAIEQAFENHSSVSGIVFTFAQCTEASPLTALSKRFEVLARLAQLAAAQTTPPKLWLLVTEQSHTKLLDPSEPVGVALQSMARSLFLEFPTLRGGIIDCLSANYAAVTKDLLAPDGEDLLKWVQDVRHVARLESTAVVVDPVNALKAQASYLITGGLGGLGLRTAQRLAERGAGQLILLGRSKPSPAALLTIEHLRALGAKVQTLTLDVTDEAAVQRLIQDLQASEFPLRGLIHAAGIMKPTPLVQTDTNTVHDVLEAKVSGAWVLHRQTQALDLDFFIMFGSISSQLGTADFSAYTSANGFLAGLAQLRRRHNLPALCIDWGVWQEGGMVSADALRASERSGFKALAFDRGLNALEQLLGASATQVAVVDADWRTIKSVFGTRRAVSLLNNLGDVAVASEPSHSPTTPTNVFLKELKQTPAREKLSFIRQQLQLCLAKVLRFSEDQLPAVDWGFFDMGMDSISAVEFRLAIEALTQLELNQSVVFDYPNTQALATYLSSLLSPTTAATQLPDSTPSTSSSSALNQGETLQSDLEDISQLSDEQLAALIDGELDALTQADNKR